MNKNDTDFLLDNASKLTDYALYLDIILRLTENLQHFKTKDSSDELNYQINTNILSDINEMLDIVIRGIRNVSENICLDDEN